MTQKRGGPPQKGPGGGQRQMHVRLKTARKHRPSSQRWLERQLNDPYVTASKRDGMRSRAAYKLSEIDDKYHFLKPGAHVVDLGAAPGGWSQIAAERVQSIGGKGQVVAIDILPMEALPGVEVLHLDFTEEGAEEQLKALLRDGHADIVLSDMAAPTTGPTRTDHLRIMALAEAAATFPCAVLRVTSGENPPGSTTWRTSISAVKTTPKPWNCGSGLWPSSGKWATRAWKGSPWPAWGSASWGRRTP